MKRQYKFLVAPLLLSLSLHLSTPAQAAHNQSEVEQIVSALSIMVGDTKGDLKLSSTVTRAEFIAMTVNMLERDHGVASPTTSPYPDVTATHWAAGYVAYGVQKGLVSGYSDGTFKPNNQITLGEASVIVPNVLGFSAADFQGYTMDGRVSWMASKGLLQNVEVSSNTDILTRKDCMYIFYNALTAQNKAGGTLLQSMGYTLSSDGEIDRMDLIEELMEGPMVATGNWKNELPFDIDTLRTVTIDGVSGTGKLSDIGENDLVYWIESIKALWVYPESTTGVLENVGTDTVTVAGVTYDLETEEAKYQVSSLGQYRKGDMVTALLGKDEGVAAFVSPQFGSSVVAGIVSEVGTIWHEDSVGGSYEGPSVTILATDGTEYTFPLETATSAPIGSVFQVTVGNDNKVSLEKYVHNHKDGMSGTINEGVTMMGHNTLARDLEVIDVYQDQGVEIYASRLAGLQISRDDIAYYRLNAQGEIDRLILKDVTGEMHNYGLLEKISDLGSGMMVSMKYSMILNQSGDIDLNLSTRFPIEAGPVMIKGAVNAPESITSIKSSELRGLDSASAIISGSTYMFAQEMVCYEKQGDHYYTSSVSRLMEGDFKTITGYYVSATDRFIRMIIAE